MSLLLMCCMGGRDVAEKCRILFYLCIPAAYAFYVLRISNYSMKQIIINHFHIHGDYIAGDGIDIHDNQQVIVDKEHDQNPLNDAATQTNDEPVAPNDARSANDILPIPQEEDIPFFKYIHPSITTDEDKRQVHCEVQNLVRRFSMADICRYLRQMCKEHRVYLNVKPEAMFVELHRLGMPDETQTGFSYKNFMNYFNIND